MAAVVSADLRLADGCDRLFHDKAIAEQQLSQAIELYGKELEQGGNPSLRQRATFGLARAWEAKGDLDKATRRYQEVVANWPDGAFAAAARERLDDLKRPAVKQLYDDLRKFNPKTVAPRESGAAGRDAQFRPRRPARAIRPPAARTSISRTSAGKRKQRRRARRSRRAKETRNDEDEE